MNLRISLLGLILLALLLVGIFILARRIARRHGWAVTLILPSVLILAAVFALVAVRTGSRSGAAREMARVSTLSQAPYSHTLSSPAEPATGGHGDRLGPPPAPDFDQEPDADVYPSVRSGAVALTGRLLASLDKLIPDGVKLGAIVIDGNAPPDILAVVADAARARLPEANVGLNGLPVNAPAGEAKATLHVLHQVLSPSQVQITAQLLPERGNGITEYVRILEKPWVENLAHMPATDGHRFVVHSELAGSQGQARAQALGLAVERLRHLMENRLGPAFRPGQIRKSEEQWLNEQLRADLESGRLAKDRFEQKITKPYGQLWRNSILVDIPETQLADLTRDYLHGLSAERAGWRHTLLMAAGLVLGIVVLYLFLNAATKGYYTWMLRTAGLVVVAAGVCFVLTTNN